MYFIGVSEGSITGPEIFILHKYELYVVGLGEGSIKGLTSKIWNNLIFKLVYFIGLSVGSFTGPEIFILHKYELW